MATYIERIEALLAAPGYTYDPELKQFMFGCTAPTDRLEIGGLENRKN